MARDLVSARTVLAVRRLVTDAPKDRIAEWWQAERFAPAQPWEPVDSSVRRDRFSQYASTVDWSDPEHVTRAVQVFDQVLSAYRATQNNGTSPTEEYSHALELLERDGIHLDSRNHLERRRGVDPPASLASLRDPASIEEAFERAAATVDTDPRAAIGAAKELIEATAKSVLRQLERDVDEPPDLPALIKAAQVALHLHPSQDTSGPDGTDAVRKVLGGLSAAAIGIAELRNQGYGTGHGQATRPVGLHPRHARLAVAAASAWSHMILDTHADASAPWTKTADRA